jgi:hypothetical protein
MTTLLDPATATYVSATQGNVKSWITNISTFISDLLGTDSTNKGSALVSLGALLNGSAVKTGSYTVVASDRGKVLTFTGGGGYTVSLPAAASLGDGFAFALVNNTSGTITIDPNLSETVNGATAYAVQSTETVIVFCDGAKLILFGKAPAAIVNSLNGAHGDITAAQVAAAAIAGGVAAASSAAPMTAFVAASVGAIDVYGGTQIILTRANGGTVVLVTTPSPGAPATGGG